MKSTSATPSSCRIGTTFQESAASPKDATSWNSFDWSNLLDTVLVAIVGAAVSYLTSRLLEGRRRRNW
ncbi:hypothetical protein [Sphingobacterium arenae]|uniref:Uncharacterized protein n=1 Tax=Sphingobacterium arenae TaxID=1280598 RepID=A0ABR7Y8X3_9SPHI|nr:hypothetical protein [Sphingobacterium arenae]MBD1427763.1 hypothetical protein [Sphingobacterium arenae]